MGAESLERLGAGIGAGLYAFPMKATIDTVGRVVVPKLLRDSQGFRPGSMVDISR
jgi:hypothetical protein